MKTNFSALFSRAGLLAAALLATPCVLSAADDLPDYRPQVHVTGVLRGCGNPQMAALMKRWETGFKRLQPDVQFADDLKSSASGLYGLDMRTADLALLGRPVYPYERYGIYERSWVYPAVIEVATGSAGALHKSPAYAVFVHKDNPLARLSVRELDGVFGAERAGGWNALTWDTSVARGGKDNLRTWGQLGLTGEWADKPVHVYGQPGLGAGAITYFQARVFGGAETWNEGLREYADRQKMLADLAQDPLGIAYAPAAYANAGVKTLPLAETKAGPYVALSPASVADRTYPLHRPVYVVYTMDDRNTDLTPTLGDPRVKEFIRYILSRQGQQDVVAEGGYLPLPAPVVQAQLQKLNSTAIPPEHQFMEN
ncbi:substrate-binding domain-containing protein [Opitutus sp. GAS368]|jgi:phosphate transport system substrate-binding protein|uniref:PstS family phosphate ABC transporter substrate-binding protein n=1 Tax=Opitutus sp. GAS368 TaxID=1882749 RepID=UPI00087CE8BD|nr:substrate-binding domain-containing protein [Opitutus sp. GAS368]SDR90327.1 phosphate transport system substrate-binding protein [Opitutus sp. GAS368]